MANFIKRLRDIHFITLIFLVAFVFRFYMLSEYPVSLSMDEVSIGYNAYSILKTGKDEWGIKFPLAFRSVGDYKPPVNIYLTVPSIALFGLNELAVRFPVALLGSLSAVLLTLILKKIGLSRTAYVFGGFWLAIVPWHVHFSRGSFEAVTALFFLLWGLYIFLKSVESKSTFLFGVSVSLFSLSVWAYHAQRLFVPLLFIFLVFINRKRIIFLFGDIKKLLIVSLFVSVLIIPFLTLGIFTEAVTTRALSTSVFREQSLIRALHDGKYLNFGLRVFDNDIYVIFKHIVGKYLNYFDLRFWFWKGMQFTPPDFFDMGFFYTVDLVLILVGIPLVFFSKNKLVKRIGFFWFLVGPLPASFTMNEQHPLRSLVWIPFFGLAAAVGFEFIVKKFKKAYIVYFILLILNIIYFKDIYFRQFPRFFSEYWQYGYKEIALYACEHKDEYKNIYISETFGTLGPLNTGIPYIYVLFFCKYEPSEYMANRSTDNINFRRFQWKSDIIEKDALIIGTQWDLPPDEIPKDRMIKQINYPGGLPAFLFVETKVK